MKVVILSVADRRHMTPSSVYENYFNEKSISYDVICTDRYNENSDSNNHYFYRWKDSRGMSKLQKLPEYIKFRLFAIKIINKNDYDFIVVWNENTAALFSTYLVLKYKNRFCINIRDTVADIGPLQKFAWIAINRAVYCTRPWVRDIEKYPKETYSVLNYDKKILNTCLIKTEFQKQGEPIIITYMGLARIGINTFRRFIDCFANDKRFLLRFFGTDCDTLIGEYIRSKGIENCEVAGTFAPEKTSEYLDKTDVIMNYYNTGGSQLKFTIGIKASYGPFLRIPQIVDDDTYWAEVCELYGFGFPVKDEKNLADDFYKWYTSLDFNKFSNGCDGYIRFLKETNKPFYKKCDEVFLSGQSK